MVISSSISIIWGIVLSTVPYFMLAFIPVWDQRRFSKMTAVIAGSLCVFLNVASVIFIIQFFQDWESLHIYYSIFFLLLYIGVYLSMIRGTPSKLIFIALLVKSYADFVMNICKYLEVEYIAHFKNWDYAQSLYSIQFNIFQCLTLVITYPIIWMLFRKKIKHVMQTRNKAWRFLWIIPLVYYIISLSFTTIDNSLTNQWQFLIFSMVSFSGFCLIYYVVIEMLEQSEKNVILAKSNELIKQQLIYQSEYYIKFGECIEETHKAEHDLRQHLYTVMGLIQQKNNENIEKYITDLLGTQLSISDILYCSNHAVNAILGYYANACKQENIDFLISTKVPDDLEIDETDLCVVFGNVLENAVDACNNMISDKKQIKISSQLRNDQLFITVDNSFNGEVKLRNGIYLSQKRNEESGIGIISVMAIAQKYAGEASFKVVDQVFMVSVVLTNKNPQKTQQLEMASDPFGINNNACHVEH